MVKVKAQDADVIAVGEALAELVDPARRDGSTAGSASASVSPGPTLREIEIYRQQDPRFRRHSPALLRFHRRIRSRTWVAAVEYIDDARGLDSCESCTVAERHTSTRGRRPGRAARRSGWIAKRNCAARPGSATCKSRSGCRDVGPLGARLRSMPLRCSRRGPVPDIAAIHRRLVSRIDDWWPALEAGPRTLIHNDFNPRNVCLRGPDATPLRLRLGAGDARRAAARSCGVPVLRASGDVTLEEVTRWIERHRSALERQRGRSIDRGVWLDGFRSGLYDLLINSLSIYAVVHRVRSQPFLPRFVRTWRHLYQLFPLEGAA